MNVDGLHQTSGATNEEVAEVHGSVLKYRCMSCHKKLPNLLGSGGWTPQQQPRCDACGGRARPDVTLFTESLPEDEWHKAVDWMEQLQRGGVLLVAGTISVVYPAASLPDRAAANGATIIEFNLDFLHCRYNSAGKSGRNPARIRRRSCGETWQQVNRWTGRIWVGWTTQSLFLCDFDA